MLWLVQSMLLCMNYKVQKVYFMKPLYLSKMNLLDALSVFQCLSVHQYLGDIKQRLVPHVAPDGHCLLHAWLECLKNDSKLHNISGTFDEFHILSKLEVELKSNLPYYTSSLPDTVDIIQQFELHRDCKVLDTVTGDILLPALCNCFQADTFTVEQETFGNFAVRLHILPCNTEHANKMQRTYYLLRTNDHYDALIIPGKCTLFKTNSNRCLSNNSKSDISLIVSIIFNVPE